jgi:hypothetical protein
MDVTAVTTGKPGHTVKPPDKSWNPPTLTRPCRELANITPLTARSVKLLEILLSELESSVELLTPK